MSPETTSVEFDLLSHHVTVGWDRFNKHEISEMTLKSVTLLPLNNLQTTSKQHLNNLKHMCLTCV